MVPIQEDTSESSMWNWKQDPHRRCCIPQRNCTNEAARKKGDKEPTEMRHQRCEVESRSPSLRRPNSGVVRGWCRYWRLWSQPENVCSNDKGNWCLHRWPSFKVSRPAASEYGINTPLLRDRWQVNKSPHHKPSNLDLPRGKQLKRSHCSGRATSLWRFHWKGRHGRRACQEDPSGPKGPRQRRERADPLYEWKGEGFVEEMNKALWDHLPLEIQDKFWWPLQRGPAHWIDKISNKFMDSEFVSGLLMRTKLFHILFGHGNMHSVAKATATEVNLPFSTTISFAKQRFLSSSYQRFDRLEKSFCAYVNAYRDHDNKEINEYKVAGQDFVFDLLGLIDLLTPSSFSCFEDSCCGVRDGSLSIE